MDALSVAALEPIVEVRNRSVHDGREPDTAPASDQQVRLMVQTPLDVLPPEYGERRLLEGFLAGRDSLPEAPRQERLF